jgi:hypothetical protein
LCDLTEREKSILDLPEVNNMENADRVRANTAEEINRQIDRDIEIRVREYSHRTESEIARRINELEREGDIERLLETNASLLAFTGLVLGITRSRKWLIVPGIVLPFLFQHSIQGWCPPVPILRRLGVRTRDEIDREKYALKALRGDFDEINSMRRPEEAEDALEAVKA